MKRLSLLLGLVLVQGLPASPADQALQQTREDLRASTAELTALRAAQAEERRPLAQRLQNLQSDVRILRAELNAATMRQRDAGQVRALRERRLQALEEDHRFVRSLLSEYRRSFEVRAGMAEILLLEDRLRSIDGLLENRNNATSLPDLVEEVLGLGLAWQETRLGGVSFDGAALDAGGVERQGRFTLRGPAAWFASPDGSTAGLAATRFGSAYPAVMGAFNATEKNSILNLVSGQEAPVPLDVSSGDALKVEASGKSLFEHLLEGGVVMIPLVLVAGWALVLAGLKFVQLRRVGSPDETVLHDVVEALQRGCPEEAAEHAERFDDPMGPVIREGLSHRDAPREFIEEIMHERILIYVPVLEKHLGTLAVIGGIAPLLGLLGTVTGMIHTFQLVSVFGTGEARLLSGGISEALVTTEVGLVVAIPVLLLHAYLARRVRTVIAELEQAAAHFVQQMKPQPVRGEGP